MGISSGISTKWFFIHCCQIELFFDFFVEGGKPENPEKNPRSRDENQQQTQPTCNAGSRNRTRATLVGGERSHHCAIPAPPMYFLFFLGRNLSLQILWILLGLLAIFSLSCMLLIIISLYTFLWQIKLN